MSEISLMQMADKTNELWELKQLISEKDKEVKTLREKKTQLESEIIQTLEACNVDSFSGQKCKVKVSPQESIRIPQTTEDKKAFFEYLKKRGLFYEYLNVNSRTLNKFWKTESELVLQTEGKELSIPGIGEPTYFAKLSITKA